MKLVCSLLLFGCLAAPCLAESIRFEEQSVMKYTRIYTDDYGNHNHQEYHAYQTELKDAAGRIIPVDVWHGPMTGFHENGRKQYEGIYRHGQRDGVFTFYDVNGKKAMEIHFKQGEFHGAMRQWNRQGVLVAEGFFEDGREHSGTFLQPLKDDYQLLTFAEGKEVQRTDLQVEYP